MWKVGDKIRFVKNGVADSTEKAGFKIGQVYEILNIHPNYRSNIYLDKNEIAYTIYFIPYNETHEREWFIEPNSFELLPKNDNPEIDWLDRVQENFKEI